MESASKWWIECRRKKAAGGVADIEKAFTFDRRKHTVLKNFMEAEVFKKIWRAERDPLEPISTERLDAYPLQERTRSFLTKAGLPREAEPQFRFCRDVDEPFEGVSCLTELYDVPGVKQGRYVVIGMISGANPVAIDTHHDDMIVELDSELDFEPYFINASIQNLAECLVVYRDFVKNINDLRGEGAYQASKFTDAEFEYLKKSLEKAEPGMSSGDGFWNMQLEWEWDLRAERHGNLMED